MNAPDECAAEPPGSGAEPATGEGDRHALRLISRTAAKAWEDSFISMSAPATVVIWMTLSLPPLLLGLLGSLGFVASWFSPDTVQAAQREIVRLAPTVFSTDVVNEIIRPTVSDILTQGHSSIVSVGFVISLWASSWRSRLWWTRSPPLTISTPCATRCGNGSSRCCSTRWRWSDPCSCCR